MSSTDSDQPLNERERRKTSQRDQDKETEKVMKALRKDFEAHVLECTRNSKELRAEVNEMASALATNHSQNKERLDAIKQVNQEQLDLLNGLVVTKRTTVWIAGAVKWVVGLLASGGAAVGLISFVRSMK